MKFAELGRAMEVRWDVFLSILAVFFLILLWTRFPSVTSTFQCLFSVFLS
jgi:glycerol-3-phosphate acyltransferase PlsY